MLRVCLVYVRMMYLFCSKKVMVYPLKAVLLVVMPLFLLTGGHLLFPPLKAEAGAKTAGTTQPAYFQQLEEYSAEIEQYKDEQERLIREKALKEALIQHTVQPGETLTHIAHTYCTDLESLLSCNGIDDPNLIFPGQVLNLLSIPGTVHLVCRGDTLQSIAERYQSRPQIISDFNLLEEPLQLVPGKRLVIPGGVLPPEEKKAIKTVLLASRHGLRKTSFSTPSFDWPVKGRISSHYGWREGGFHHGLDIAVPLGSTIRAAAAGVVQETGTKQGYGLMLTVEHSGGWKTLYAHCSRLLVKEEQKVSRGQPIALIGETGNATGPHLHLEIIQDEERFDPLEFLSGSVD